MPDTSLREPSGVRYDGAVVRTFDIGIIEHRGRGALAGAIRSGGIRSPHPGR
jgi:hypothetical protein